MSRDSSPSRGEKDDADADDRRDSTRSPSRPRSRPGSEPSWNDTDGLFGPDSGSAGPDTSGATTVAEAERYYGRDLDDLDDVRTLQRLERTHGREVHDWVDDGVPLDAMGDPDAIQRFSRRERTPVPWNIEELNRESKRRNTSLVQRTRREGPAGEVGVPESVREVVASPGRPLDDTIQRAVESRTGDSFGDVRIHTGPRAAQAAAAIDARAFTVGNHIAFGQGEYDPTTPAGQHILVHELAHVRQQTGGALSMLPQEGLGIDPDERLEREAEESARRVMRGGELGVQQLAGVDSHVQRLPKGKMFDALALFESQDDVGQFRETQNKRQHDFLLSEIDSYVEVRERLAEIERQREIKTIAQEIGVEERDLTAAGKEWIETDYPNRSELQQAQQNLESALQDSLDQIALTEEQRSIISDGVGTGFWSDVGAATGATMLAALLTSSVAGGAVVSISLGAAYAYADNHWSGLSGDLEERAQQLVERIESDTWQSEQGDRPEQIPD